VPPIDQAAMPAGSETILVVEDDDMVRSYVEKELSELGYRVIAARNGREALEFCASPAKSSCSSPTS
jgi:CheY-like chemotaxis protein